MFIKICSYIGLLLVGDVATTAAVVVVVGMTMTMTTLVSYHHEMGIFSIASRTAAPILLA